MFGWIKKVPKVLKIAINIVNDPRVAIGLDIATMVIPGGQILKVKKVLSRVKVAEHAFGAGKGIDKFNKVFQELQNDPLISDNKELRDLIEKAVMAVNGTVVLLDDHGNKVE